jgi:hypothetical protein
MSRSNLLQSDSLRGIDCEQLVQPEDLNQFGAKGRRPAQSELPVAFSDLFPGGNQYRDKASAKMVNR